MTVTTENKKELAKKFKNLIGPTDPKLDRDIRERLVTARVGMLLRASFFGNLATRLKLINADEWCATAATDGRHFYYNTRFIKMLKPKEVEFLFGHEVLHCVYDHFGRRGDRDPQLFNIANDYCVNADLKKHRVGEFITSVPCLYDPKFQDMASEEIYDILYENAEKIDIGSLIDKMLDEHLDGEGDSEGSGDKDGNGGGRPKYSSEEKQKIRDEIKEAVLAAAAASDGAGNLPAGVKRIIQDMTAPKMNWRELIRMQLESTIKSDYTWLRSSRRGWHMDAVMPGMKLEPMIDIAISIDASGSMGEKILKDVLSEVAGIMEQFPNYRIHNSLIQRTWTISPSTKSWAAVALTLIVCSATLKKTKSNPSVTSCSQTATLVAVGVMNSIAIQFLSCTAPLALFHHLVSLLIMKKKRVIDERTN